MGLHEKASQPECGFDKSIWIGFAHRMREGGRMVDLQKISARSKSTQRVS